MKKNLTVSVIKYLAAVLVIFSHAFAIACNSPDPLGRYSFDVITFGAVGVSMLFAISGFYIARSLSKNGSNSYLKNRIKKLIPSLFVVVVLSIIILGLFFSSLSPIDYFTNKQTYFYLLNSIFIPVHNLPEVFSNNIYNSTVNGALWTMPVQVMCYCYIFVLHKLIKHRKMKVWYSIPLTIVIVIVGYFLVAYLNINILKSMFRPFICFMFGALMYQYKDYLIKKHYLLIVLVSAIICLFINNTISLNIFLAILLPYIIIYCCGLEYTSDKKVFNLMNTSYELYLVGFPIQQSITNLYGGIMNPYVNFMLSLILSIVAAYIVYNISNYILKRLGK